MNDSIIKHNQTDFFDFMIKTKKESILFHANLSALSKSKKSQKMFEDFARDEVKQLNELTNTDIEKLITATQIPLLTLNLSCYTNPYINYRGLNNEEIFILALNHEKRVSMLYRELFFLVDNSKLKKLFKLIEKEANEHQKRIECEYENLFNN